MARRVRVPIKLEIVGLNPRLFDSCFKNTLALVESRSKGNQEVSSRAVDSALSSEMQDVAPEALAIYNKVAAISIDFQRAYGRTVEVKVFERSKNRFARPFFRVRRQNDESPMPEFFVNGVRVFKGLPNSFSQLDEAIDNAFGRGSK